jgi:hypothetical protein
LNALEAEFRTIVQSAKQLSFAFLGSQASLISEVFTARQRPFFQAAKIIQLVPIGSGSLKSYIRRRYLSVGIKVDKIEEMLNLAEYKMTHKSFNNALKQLIRKGLLREDQNGNYCLADPIFRLWITRRAVG